MVPHILLVMFQQKETVQLWEKVPQANQLLFVCYAGTLFSSFKISSQWGLESPERHLITYLGQASEGTYKSSAFLKMLKPLNFVWWEIPKLSYWVVVWFCILKSIWRCSGAIKINLVPLLPLPGESSASVRKNAHHQIGKGDTRKGANTAM